MNLFTEKVIDVLQAVPSGKVVTYGQVAALAGNPKGARQVGRILHTLSAKHDLPWQRVVNARGEIVTFKADRQRKLLEAEGVVVDESGRIDLEEFRWEADADWMRG